MENNIDLDGAALKKLPSGTVIVSPRQVAFIKRVNGDWSDGDLIGNAKSKDLLGDEGPTWKVVHIPSGKWD